MQDMDWDVFGNRMGSESEKCCRNKNLRSAEVVGIIEVYIVRPPESESQKLCRLTLAMSR